MAFTRKALAGLGLAEEMIEKVMTLHGTSMADYLPKSELQTKINEAVEMAKKDMPAPDVTQSDEYKQIVEERDMLRALGGNDYASVKPKFRETVYKMIDRAEGAEAVDKQLEKIAKAYEEYFAEPAAETKPPQFGANVSGSMPKGETKPTFEGLWGLGKERR